MLVLLVLRVEITSMALLQLIIPLSAIGSYFFGSFITVAEIVEDMIYSSRMAFDFVMVVDTK